MFRVRVPAVVLVLAALQSGCATNPVTGQRQLSLVSSGQELAMGQEGYKAVIQQYGAYDNDGLAHYVDGIGQRVAHVSHLPNLAWHYTVIDDDAVNAFAMPGGYIYITRGILAHLNSEAQLAGVLGHETGHVTARHSAQQITRQELAGLGVGVAGILSPTFRRFGGMAQQGLQLLFLSYSRENETQADQLGVDYATKANFDPHEIPKTYVMLGRVSDAAGQRLPSYLSTHPDPGNREIRTGEEADQAAAGRTGLVVNSGIYIDHLEGVVFGQDPRQGYFEGARFYHPDMRFQMDFPAGWKTQNTRSGVAAANSAQTAQMQLGVAAATMSPSAYVRSLGQNGKIADANGRSETIGGYDAWVGVVTVAAQDGSRQNLDAAFLQRNDQMFSVLGLAQSPEDESRIFESARSFRLLSDPARLAATPDRVYIARAPSAGSFRSVVQRLGPQAISMEQTSILNNRMPDDPVAAGERIKIVVPGHRR